ncbi:MAG: 4a-hydroxytetrahydrobiopterin dehydratase [Planctomycetes bacterium]|nr:4a-hydroxytetrahydrobiopterin dehydratase [Planctomycetota bacterium]
MTSELAKKECVPCKGGTPPLPPEKVQALLGELDEWTVQQEFHLTRSFDFPDFAMALEFVNRVGEIAEQQQHHPDIYLAWGKVRVEVWTHKIRGLTESDFILAARVDAALPKSGAD